MSWRARRHPPTARPRRRRTLILALLATIMFVLLVVVAFASWQFSSEVLDPGGLSLPEDARVLAEGAHTVTFARSKDTMQAGTYGLDWRGGHAVLGGVLSTRGPEVTRELSDLNGKLARGMNITIDANVYEGDPQHALHLRSFNVAVPDPLGPMPAWLIPGRSSTWAIVVHGLDATRAEDLRIAPTLHHAGLTSLLISYREDPGAPRSPDGLHHMGLTEWQDLQAAARYALSAGARALVLVGYSMGGSIVTQFLQHSRLKSRVRGVILDSPALSWRAILAFDAKEVGLPSFAAVPVEWMIDARIDADWSSLDALVHTAAFHLPILLFQGTNDTLVPIACADAFARKLRHWVIYYRVRGAGHTEAWNLNPTLYDERVSAFLRLIGA